MNRSIFLFIVIGIALIAGFIVVESVFLRERRVGSLQKQEIVKSEDSATAVIEGKEVVMPLGIEGRFTNAYYERVANETMKNVEWRIYEIRIFKDDTKVDPIRGELMKATISARFTNNNANVAFQPPRGLITFVDTVTGNRYEPVNDFEAENDPFLWFSPMTSRDKLFEYFIPRSASEIRLAIGQVSNPDRVLVLNIVQKEWRDVKVGIGKSLSLVSVSIGELGSDKTFCFGENVPIYWSALSKMRTVDLFVREAGAPQTRTYTIGTFPADFNEFGGERSGAGSAFGNIIWKAGQVKEGVSLDEGFAYEILIQGMYQNQLLSDVSDNVFSLQRCEG